MTTETLSRPIGWGADLKPESRPGVPQETEPRALPGAHWKEPEPQAPEVIVHRRPGEPLTPVFGTAQPAKGLSGVIRKAAYSIPDNRPSHWFALMLGDRVDVVESALTDAVRTRPVLTIAAAAIGALALTAWLSRD